MPKRLALLRFKVHQLELGGKRFLLLPKLNERQVGILENRLAKAGFSVERGPLLRARSKDGTISLSPAGVSWSAFDASDALLPAIPDLVDAPKERVPLTRLRESYFKGSTSDGATRVQLHARIEHSSIWSKLRASGQSGLTPDEHAVARFFIARAKGYCGLVTDFPVDDPTPHIFGRKRYFDSSVDPAEALSTLRVVGAQSARNAFLRRDGSLGFAGVSPVTRREWLDFFDELGEWCFFTPS